MLNGRCFLVDAPYTGMYSGTSSNLLVEELSLGIHDTDPMLQNCISNQPFETKLMMELAEMQKDLFTNNTQILNKHASWVMTSVNKLMCKSLKRVLYSKEGTSAIIKVYYIDTFFRGSFGRSKRPSTLPPESK